MSRAPSGTAERQLHRFHGGLHLADHKALSNQQPIADAGIPAQLILPLQQHHGHEAVARVEVGQTVFKGDCIACAQGDLSASVHAPTSGVIRAIESRAIADPRGRELPCIVLEPDGQDSWLESWRAQMPAIADFTAIAPDALIQRIEACGLVGLGGAVFPSSTKLRKGMGKNVHTLIMNGAECEPFITCDDVLMQEQPRAILLGVAILLRTLQIDDCLIGIEDNKARAIEALQHALHELQQDGLLGATQIISVPTIYPSGGEKQLIQLLTGKEVPSGGLPLDLGMLCHNIGTAAAVYEAVVLGQPLLSRVVTVTGSLVRRPQNFRVLLGTPIAHLLEAAGGQLRADTRVIHGGPMMGYPIADVQQAMTKSTNCILLPDDTELPPQPAARACIRCGACADVCPVSLLPQQLYWHTQAGDFARAADFHVFDCIECGCCNYVCPSHIPLVSYYRHAKSVLRHRAEETMKADHARQRFEAREARLARLDAERQARLRKKKDALDASTGSHETAQQAISAAVQRVADKKAQQQASDQEQP